MPMGSQHTAVTILNIPIASIGAYFIGGWNLVAVLAGAMLAGDLLLSPDLDHSTGSNAYKTWGLFRWIWIPYQRMVPHRSWMSHWPIFGTFGRMFYLLLIPCIVLFFTNNHEQAADLVYAYRLEVLTAIIGIELSAILHWLGDLIF